MPNLLAMSFEGALAPSFDLRCLHPGRRPPDGWGIGYYPAGEPAAAVLKEPSPPVGSIRSELVRAWEHLASSLFVVHVRSATWGPPTDANTQPFARAHGRRDWLFAHSGTLRQRPVLPSEALFQPVGSTDTEAILCELLGRVAGLGLGSLGELDPEELVRWMAELNALGSLTSVLADGRDLAVYADRDPAGPGLWALEVRPPHPPLRLEDADLAVDLASRGARARQGVVVASEPMVTSLPDPPAWRRVPPGHLLLVRHGAVRAVVSPPGTAPAARAGFTPRPVTGRPPRAEPQRLRIAHRTVYRYARPVERSTHLFRLTPVHDRLQTVLQCEVEVSVPGRVHDYEDVFGNRVRRLSVETPFTEMVIEARSLVEALDTDPLASRPFRARTTIPLVWMPWHRQVLQPFLLPPELAETELEELSDYAMSFADRNDFDVLETLLDINATLHREYRYVPGATTLFTTPFDFFAQRRGVCQDFTNLLVCLARLLGVPARYVCGYLHTGAGAEGQAQADASHAWAQVYLPEVGWRGFDPTNGVLTQTGHVRVSTGRSAGDATPTSGTIYVGGGGETLEAVVSVERVG
ncbi:MAG TPA: class II glutamine amidotransferase [Anaeromyxobacter sp.]|nr:class II glutamine amidotransferase [Anaeromyxobacter sp.]